MSTTTPPHIRLEMLSQPLYLCGARELISSIARRIGFDELSCNQIALAVDEALANVWRHGYSSQTDRPIWLSVWPLIDAASDANGVVAAPAHSRHAHAGAAAAQANSGTTLWPKDSCGCDSAALRNGCRGIRVVIEDEAKQVDPETIRSRDLEDIRPGGLGVHIIQHVMDFARYEKREERGMRLILEKRLVSGGAVQTTEPAARKDAC